MLAEAPDDLARSLLRLGGGRGDELVPRHPVDPLRGQHAFRRQLRHQLGDAHPRVAGEVLGELGQVLRLAPVVELLAHAGPQLVDEPPGVEALQRQRREHRVHHLGPVEVLLDGVADAGELDLDGELAAVERVGPVHLADAGRGHGQVLPAREHPLRLVAELVAHDAAASDGAIGAASACSGGQRGLGLVGQPPAMKLTSWPTFISTPFISPSSLATSSAVRMANCSSSSARRSAGVTSWRALVPAKRPALRAVIFHIRRERQDMVAPSLRPAAAATSQTRAPRRQRRRPAPASRRRRPGSARRRACRQEVVGQALAAHLVGPVRAVVEAGQRRFHAGEVAGDGVEVGNRRGRRRRCGRDRVRRTRRRRAGRGGTSLGIHGAEGSAAPSGGAPGGGGTPGTRRDRCIPGDGPLRLLWSRGGGAFELGAVARLPTASWMLGPSL